MIGDRNCCKGRALKILSKVEEMEIDITEILLLLIIINYNILYLALSPIKHLFN